MKHLVAYLFLFIFSFQVLPVKEIGKILFKNQLTEEVKESGCEDGCDGETSKLKKEGDPLQYTKLGEQQTARIQYLSHSLQTAIHEAERLPIHHVGEILTPPPNC
jgi:hypothetical protein